MKRIVQIQNVRDGIASLIWLSTGELSEAPEDVIRESLMSFEISPKRLEGLVISWDTKTSKVFRFVSDTRLDILVDKHQPVSHLKRLGGISASLVSGDYAWTTVHGFSVGIEAKLTAADLYSSLWAREGEARSRLAGQIPRLVEHYDIPILLLNGAEMDCTPDGFFRIPALANRGEDVTTRQWSAVENTLLGYQIRYPKLNIWMSRKTWRITEDIKAIRKYLNKTAFRSQAVTPSNIVRYFEKDMSEEAAWLAARVGPAAAKQALLTFGTLLDIFNSPRRELLKIPGWGPKTVDRLLETLNKSQRTPVEVS